MPQSQSEIHEVKPQPILTLAQATYLPHYTMRETWVGLDCDERMTSQLIAAGAKLGYMQLWERPWTAAWLERNAKKLS
jgi:hypothetical protein